MVAVQDEQLAVSNSEIETKKHFDLSSKQYTDPSVWARFSSTIIVESTSLQTLQSSTQFGLSLKILSFAFALTWCDNLQTMRKLQVLELASFSTSFLEEELAAAAGG